jgi:hypothetical protein
MAKRYIVESPHVVAGRTGGAEIKRADVENLSILIASGRVRVDDTRASVTIKKETPDSSEEE